jgi:hypothetical protein
MSTTDTTTTNPLLAAREFARTVQDEQRHNRRRAEHLGALLRTYETDRTAAFRLPRGTNTDNATRCERLALVSARIIGVWRLITAHTAQDLSLPDVYRHAAVLAECDARDTARFWRDTAADWRARAEGRPTSDAAGALSNWHELGVTA